MDKLLVHDFIKSALAEDVGDGDHTSLSTIPAGTTGKARLLVKDNGILAGMELAAEIFAVIDEGLQLTTYLPDGAEVKTGDIALEVEGSVHSILKAERLVLNCMQRMSGIATKTHEIMQLLKGTGAKVLDTRKTTPNFRYFEKWAVQIGGGVNHRFGLFDMILIKDNHVDYSGGIRNAIANAQQYLKDTGRNLKIEIEVRNLDELQQALDTGGIHRIMFDNFSIENTKKAVALVSHKYETESSGGITLETIHDYAACGVDYISVGALTHSVKSLDLSLKAVK